MMRWSISWVVDNVSELVLDLQGAIVVGQCMCCEASESQKLAVCSRILHIFGREIEV
jgi:hypothetical protein